MTHRFALRTLLMLVSLAMLASGCGPRLSVESPALVGAWRSNVQFKSGSFAAVKDLEFMYVFHSGGTMMESSNYDSVPPVPPAYGVWRPAGAREFQATYEYFTTKPPASFDELKAGGWMPSGRGVLKERIRVSEDGRTFTSTIQYETLDAQGNPVAGGGGEAEGRGVRIGS